MTQDYKAAIQYYELAAGGGHPQAQCNLGVMHQYGRGTARSMKRAFKLYELAANQGYSAAQFKPGIHVRHWDWCCLSQFPYTLLDALINTVATNTIPRQI